VRCPKPNAHNWGGMAGTGIREQQPHSLSESEATVLRELEQREAAATSPRLARTYRRIIDLSRIDDSVDAILAAHLARELMSAVPGALGIELSTDRLEYVSQVQDLALSWPAEARTADPPGETVLRLRRLLEEHERASGRAREGPRALIRREDRATPGYVLEPPLTQWVALSSRGSGLAHRLRNVDRELPDPAEVRRLVDELTAMLLAVLAPYFVGIAEVDRLLGLTSPTQDDARQLAALLSTPSHYRYFFDRADEQWLEPLAATGRILSTPPALVDVGEGYVQAPDWPQGRFLARVAPRAPEQVVALVERVPASDNPRIAQLLVEVARALPPGLAVKLVPGIARRIAVPLAVDYAALEAGELAKSFADVGLAPSGVDLLLAVVDATLASPRDLDWHLEQVLTTPIEALAPAASNLGPALRSRVLRVLRKTRYGQRYSNLLVRNIDVPPRYGVDASWLLANALYRVLLANPEEQASVLTADLFNSGEPLLARIALAAICERPELAIEVDTLLLDPETWDAPDATRYEFRRALRSLWTKASEPAQRALLNYAEEALEAGEIIARLTASGVEHDAAELTREWRSRLLYQVREELPQDWLERVGPLNPVEDDRIPESTAEWVRSSSPVSEEELGGRNPDEVIALLREWTPDAGEGRGEPSVEGLADVAAVVVGSRLGEFADRGQDFAGLRPRIASKVLSAIARDLREDEGTDDDAIARFALDFAETYLAADPETDEWSDQCKRSLANMMEVLAHRDHLVDDDVRRALAVLVVLLRDADPTPESETRDLEGGYDVGMLALNSVRGDATTAEIELLLACRRLDNSAMADAASQALRSAIANDHARSARAAIGLRLPWLLAQDASHQAEWLDLLFGSTVPEIAQSATWEGYLTYARFFTDLAPVLAPQYQASLDALEPRPQDERGRPRDSDEQLGIHVATAHLLAIPVAMDGNWLVEFYARTAPWLRGRVTRWIGEQAASAEVAGDVRERARRFLAERVSMADAEMDAEELQAVSWIASATDHEGQIVETILLPALEKTSGATENEVGALGLAARLSSSIPRAAARVVQLLVEGDRWHSLPHIASSELRAALDELVRGQDEAAREIAEDTINTLGAQGFLEFRALLSDGGGPAEIAN